MSYPPMNPFHGGNTGSNPVGDADKTKCLAKLHPVAVAGIRQIYGNHGVLSEASVTATYE